MINSIGFSSNILDNLRKELKEKEDKIIELTGRRNKGNLGGTWYKNSYNSNNLQRLKKWKL